MKDFIGKLITKTGHELYREFKTFNRQGIRYKSKHQLVTKADLIAEKHLLSALRKKYPHYQILSEESGLDKVKSDYLWIVDPLDGTTNFALKNPLFGINLGLAYRGEMIFGAIYAPFLNILIMAEKDKGAYLNGKKIHVSKQKKLLGAFITFCHGSSIRDVKRAIKIYEGLKIKYSDLRQMGSSVIEMGWVAAGYTDAHFVPGACLWDVAPGALIVREAGGQVTDYQGRNWTIKSKDIVASNGHLHQPLLKEIRHFDK